MLQELTDICIVNQYYIVVKSQVHFIHTAQIEIGPLSLGFCLPKKPS